MKRAMWTQVEQTTKPSVVVFIITGAIKASATVMFNYLALMQIVSHDEYNYSKC